jgi:NADPH-dependent glutamate synthase beta subunit-like oxidoreductase/Pyruvate/2-oxoacid:ferredoxin oxidoreductase delta subunit
MKRSKDRLHRVLVIGITPAGLIATNKLGELGIPVTLVDPDPDINEKLSREEWRLASGVSLNFAHRPGLLRILRNPFIRSIIPAEVNSIKHTPQGFRARIKSLQTFIDPDRCIQCGRCLDVCPVITPDGNKPIQFNGRGSLPGRPVIDKRRKPPCQENCPLGVNAQAYISLAAAGRFQEALEVVRRNNILPGICGRVCTHPCEEACRRGELDDPIAIRDIKRFLADYELSHPNSSILPDIPKRSQRIAVIGSGPAGLASAADLARLGYQVTLFEKEASAGGLLRYGIGPHRLPRDILDYEIEYIKKLGVQFMTSHSIDLTGELDELKKDFDAVILTIGTWSDRTLGVPGENLMGVEGCIHMLTRIYRGEVNELKEEVAVIGDGNAAFDLARTLRRLGSSVTLITWFPEDLIPADKDEIRGAREEGISIVDKTQVIAFEGSSGRLESLQCKPTEPGEPDSQGIPWPVIVPKSKTLELSFGRAVVAIGQSGPFQIGNPATRENISSAEINVTANGLIEVDESLRTNITGIYAAGDGVKGPSSVVDTMASGRAVARFVHMDLSGEKISASEKTRPEDREFAAIKTDIPSLTRPKMPESQPAARCNSFSEVALGLSEAQVLFEAERCLQCGICAECLLCTEACGLVKAINHYDQPEETVEHAGAIIIADPKSSPSIKGEDVIRAYGPKAAKSDVYAMVTRGFAAASKAMILLGGTSHRPKGQGISFSPPDLELSPEIRIGVFVCRCNDSFGWHEDIDNYVEHLFSLKDIVHAEIMPSSCIPEGSAAILSAIREKGITRVVLASCICCPLDFVCSACTDQRSRLKDALFKETGISRSMVETSNLRGEVLRHLPRDPTAALNHFTGLIERSVHRARRLKTLPSPVRTYNFTTAVIGQSEAAISSVQVLSEAGFEVFMFGTPDKPFIENITYPTVHCFENTTVRSISGTLGNFHVHVESDGFSQILQVGAIILGEKSKRMIPYIPQKGLPNRILESSFQKRGVPGVPFLYPGATPIAGLFLASPPGIRVSERKKGAAAAVLAAAIMPRGPRHSKGYTVVVDKNLCRGCGRCFQVCPHQAITFKENSVGGWYAIVDESLCKGCGICISVCPSHAADSPYRDQAYLEQLLEEVLVQ